ncbi:MAG: hypothetical protein R2843_08495 [Thermomicrobiales bacterium]
MTRLGALGSGEAVVGSDKFLALEPQMGAEDFSYFLEQRPGCFFFCSGRETRKRGWSGVTTTPDSTSTRMAWRSACRWMLHTVLDYLGA